MHITGNPYVWGKHSNNIADNVIHVAYYDESGEMVESEATIAMQIQFDMMGTTLKSKTINISHYQDEQTGMTFHKINVTSINSSLLAEVMPSEASIYEYEVYFRKQYSPTLTTFDYRGNATKNGSKFNVFIPGQYTPLKGIYYVGLLPHQNSVGKYYYTLHLPSRISCRECHKQQLSLQYGKLQLCNLYSSK